MKALPAFLFLISLTPAFAQESVTIVQGRKTVVLAAGDTTIDLNAAPFDLAFRTYKYTDENRSAFGIAVTLDPESLVYFREGDVSENSFFAPGSGFAAEGAYDRLYLTSQGQHYVFHGDDSPSRLTGIAENGDGTVSGKWRIDRLDLNGRQKKPSFLKNRILYLMIWKDADHDSAIGSGEYRRVRINFL
jgi:hypothetical protein